MTELKTIYRAVGGNSNRNELEGYEVIAYLCYKETTRYFFTRKNSKDELHQKRTTSNSAWFYTPEEAANEVIRRIKLEENSILTTLAKCHTQFLADKTWLYVGRFRQGAFRLEAFQLIREDGDSFKVENFDGKQYYYKKEQQWIHHYEKPFGKFYSTDLNKLLAGMEEYAKQRLVYLENCIAKAHDYVRLAKREEAETNP